MRIDIWSDLICPWCYLGKRRLETALGSLSDPVLGPVKVTYRAYQLDPSPVPQGKTSGSHQMSSGLTPIGTGGFTICSQ